MEQSLDLLRSMEWFLKPIANIFLYLFTTTSGIIVLSILFGLYVIIYIANAVWERQLAYGRVRVPPMEKAFVFTKSLMGAFSNMITSLPLLLGVFLFMALLSGMYGTINTMDEFVNNQKRIKELQSVVKQISTSFKIAEIKVIDQIASEVAESSTTVMEIRYFDYAEVGFKPQTQNLTIKGNDIYIDALNINFEYSEISSNSGITNLAIPYRIFSNQIPQAEGIKLNIDDNDGVPFFFKRADKDIYGMTAETFNGRIEDIVKLASDPDNARQLGIRSSQGVAVHTRVWKGNILQIWVEQSGGITLKNVTPF